VISHKAGDSDANCDQEQYPICPRVSPATSGGITLGSADHAVIESPKEPHARSLPRTPAVAL